VTELYVMNSKSDYWFWHGINPIAAIAVCAGIAPCMPGFIMAMMDQTGTSAWTKVTAAVQQREKKKKKEENGKKEGKGKKREKNK
jgi:cytosine/uracil/thiamine/allantoin permease